jgi:hypothetical protein
MLANCTTWIARSGYSKTYRLRCTTLVTGGWPTFLPFCALHAEGARPSVLSLFEDEKGHGRPHIPVVTIQWCFQNMQSFSVAECLESLKLPSVRSALELSSFGRKELQKNNGRRSQQSARRVSGRNKGAAFPWNSLGWVSTSSSAPHPILPAAKKRALSGRAFVEEGMSLSFFGLSCSGPQWRGVVVRLPLAASSEVLRLSYLHRQKW